MTSLPSYIPIPPSASQINPPSTQTPVKPSQPTTNSTFPPTASYNASSSTSSRKFNVPTATSLSTNVSDLLLSSLLPPNLPKLAPASARGGSGGPGRPRELSTQREQLSLPLVSNNFRRFVTRVGPLFWLQDRVEEILFWRKPVWTWAWMMIWTSISFKPRLLLILPSLALSILLLHIHERSIPLPSLLGVLNQPLPAGTVRMSSGSSNGSMPNGTSTYSASTGPDGESLPVVPPKEAESGVDYYMNLQAIQNLMGLVSDVYDYVTPRLAFLTTPSTTTPSGNPTPSQFPFTATCVILLLLPPSIFLPLLPNALLPYLLLPLGILPPLLFHPVLSPLLFTLPRNPTILRIRAFVENLILTDALSDNIGHRNLGRVEVWENERLDPVIAAKPPSTLASSGSSGSSGSVSLPPGSWSARFLRAGERAPWVKVLTPCSNMSCLSDLWTSPSITGNQETLWKTGTEGGLMDLRDHSLGMSLEKGRGGEKDGEAKMVLALKDGWSFIPQEDWRVDICGLWSEVGSDADGWVYSDDSWQNPAPTAVTDSDFSSPTTGVADSMPALALRRVTRRRRWWRRVYQDCNE